MARPKAGVTADALLDAEDALRQAEEEHARSKQTRAPGSAQEKEHAKRAAALSELRRRWLRELPSDEERQSAGERLAALRNARAIIASVKED